MADGGGVLAQGGVALRWGSFSIGVVGGEPGAVCVGQGGVDLEAGMGETDTGFLQGAEPHYGVGAGDRSASCRCIHQVEQNVEPGTGDVRVKIAGGGGGAWMRAISRHARMRSPWSESSGSRRPSWPVMYPLQSAKCHELDRKPRQGRPRAPWR